MTTVERLEKIMGDLRSLSEQVWNEDETDLTYALNRGYSLAQKVTGMADEVRCMETEPNPNDLVVFEEYEKAQTYLSEWRRDRDFGPPIHERAADLILDIADRIDYTLGLIGE